VIPCDGRTVETVTAGVMFVSMLIVLVLAVWSTGGHRRK
jgi:hypothetical protein